MNKPLLRNSERCKCARLQACNEGLATAYEIPGGGLASTSVCKSGIHSPHLRKHMNWVEKEFGSLGCGGSHSTL
ncbi:hypothetical protein M758_4G107700 [Ceratodon purpureus]|nr:hypothetical protein M758_4G107700 [Ceratodon purpureus]